jgi:glycosyltransferase involved in cell wall biosynthesis
MRLVSVIIPSYNHAEFVELAVDSVLSQSYGNFELIIVDDGSRDDSVARLRRFRDPRCHIHEQLNQGAHAAINRGLALARGDFLTILNSDDIYSPIRLERLVDEIESGGDDLLATHIEVINHKSKTLGVKEGWRNMLPWEIPNLKESFLATDDFALNLLATNFVATTSNIFLRRSVYEKIGGMRNLRFAHDWDFLLRVAYDHRCRLVPEALLKYRIHPDNTITKNRAAMLFEACWNMAVHCGNFVEKHLIQDGVSGAVDKKTLRMMWNSLNPQGNYHVIWRISNLLQAMKANGIKNPEETFLNDAELRNLLIKDVVV